MFSQLVETLANEEEQLQFEFQFNCPYIEAEYYREGAQGLIQRLVPTDLLEERGAGLTLQRTRFADLLPLITWSDLHKAPTALSILLLCKYRLNACNFFYDMISRWLLPQKRVNVELFFASDVRLPSLSEDLLSVAEIVVHLKSAQDVEEVRRNLSSIETEIRLGVVSHFHARKILEFKGLSTDGKTAMIQEKIGSLTQSYSRDFDPGIFSQMQHFLVTCPEEFKQAHDYHHITRIISNLHSVRKLIKQNSTVFPTKRHVNLKFLKTRLTSKLHKEKPVLGILVGLNFLKEHEVFETSHLINAIQQHIRDVRLVEGSSFVDKPESSLQTIYLEVEKGNQSDFSLEEITLLRTALPDQIKSHVEQLTHPIFMPRNEEEVLRNILSLSRQLRFVTDRPQVVISFDGQKGSELCFTVILLRFVAEKDPTVQELFLKNHSELKIVTDRVRHVGRVRSKRKEATVFRTLLSGRAFSRPDHSVDLYKAREYIVGELSRVVGKVRDYNGGMIYKQNEALNSLKGSLGRVATQHKLLLEKFFYSLAPMEMRSILEIEPLKQLFLLLLQSIKSDPRLPLLTGDWIVKQDPRRVLAVLPQADSQKKRKLAKALETLSIPTPQLISFSVDVHDTPCIGYLYLCGDKEAQAQFLTALEKVL